MRAILSFWFIKLSKKKQTSSFLTSKKKKGSAKVFNSKINKKNSQDPRWHLEPLIYLLLNDQRVDINKADNDGISPFYVACYKGLIEIMELLLNDERVDINKTLSSGETPFYIACEKGHIRVVELLLNDERVDVNKAENKYSRTPFWIACYKDDAKIVKLLLNDQRVDINKASKNSLTPFYLACEYGQIEIVKQLLACGKEIDINKKDGDEKTALDIAREMEDEEKEDWENEFEFQERKSNYIKIIELIESFERNPNETRFKLRIELGLARKLISFYFFIIIIFFLRNLYLYL